VGAVIIHYIGWLAIDPILSILIGGLIIWTAADVTRESLNILLEGMPAGMELAAVKDAMRGVPGVIDVHHVHVWSLGSRAHALSCHAVIADMPPSESEKILFGIRHVLEHDFHIHHTTVQFEHRPCPATECCTISHHHDRR
jgi:cobalt-zinc-cadmium efflux system protein